MAQTGFRKVYYLCLLSMLVSPTAVVAVQREDTLQSPQEVFLQLDRKVQDQEKVCSEKEESLFDANGDQTAASWRAARQLSPYNLYGNELLDFAKANPATQESLRCLSYLFLHSHLETGTRFDEVVNELLKHHADDPALAYLASNCIWPARYRTQASFLKQLYERSQNPLNQAAAKYYEIELLDNCIDIRSHLPYIIEDFTRIGYFEVYPERMEDYKALANYASEEFRQQRTVKMEEYVGISNDHRPWTILPSSQGLQYAFIQDPKKLPFRQLVKKLVFQINNLREGCSPPSFSGTTTDGSDFHLEDTKGHVTILFFTLAGCGPCEARYPWIRNLIERYGPEKLKVIGIAADATEETVLSAEKSGKFTWPCIWDGLSGPIAKLYQVTGYPQIFVIDHKGAILEQGMFREREFEKIIENAIMHLPSP